MEEQKVYVPEPSQQKVWGKREPVQRNNVSPMRKMRSSVPESSSSFDVEGNTENDRETKESAMDENGKENMHIRSTSRPMKKFSNSSFLAAYKAKGKLKKRSALRSRSNGGLFSSLVDDTAKEMKEEDSIRQAEYLRRREEEDERQRERARMEEARRGL